MSSYSRPTGSAVSTAVVPYFLLQVHKSGKMIGKVSLMVQNLPSVSLKLRKLDLTQCDWSSFTLLLNILLNINTLKCVVSVNQCISKTSLPFEGRISCTVSL